MNDLDLTALVIVGPFFRVISIILNELSIELKGVLVKFTSALS